KVAHEADQVVEDVDRTVAEAAEAFDRIVPQSPETSGDGVANLADPVPHSIAEAHEQATCLGDEIEDDLLDPGEDLAHLVAELKGSENQAEDTADEGAEGSGDQEPESHADEGEAGD